VPALARQRFGQLGQAVGTHPRHLWPAGQPLAQTGDSLLERSLRSVREGTSGQVPGGSWASLRGGRAKASLAPTAPVTDPAPPFP
jgi:hypothetical protein